MHVNEFIYTKISKNTVVILLSQNMYVMFTQHIKGRSKSYQVIHDACFVILRTIWLNKLIYSGHFLHPVFNILPLINTEAKVKVKLTN